MAEKAFDTTNEAHIQETGNINKVKKLPAKRNCIAVPEVSVTKKNSKTIIKEQVKREIKKVIKKDVKRDIKKSISKMLNIFKFAKTANINLKPLHDITKRLNVLSTKYIKTKLPVTIIKNLYNSYIKKNSEQIKPSYLTGAVIAATLMITVVAGANFRPGVEVFIGDKAIGVLHSHNEYDKYLEEVTNELSQYVGTRVEIDEQPKLVNKIVGAKSFTAKSSFKAELKSVFDESIGAYAILVDGKMITALKDETTANQVLNELKKPYVGEDSNIKVEFDKDVQVQKKAVSLGEIQNAEEALTALSASENEVKTYTIKPKDTLWNIARDHDMRVDDIIAINPGLTDSIKPDQQINLTQPKPIIGVKTRQTVVFDENIPFDVEKIDDPNTYEGRKSIVKEGVEGKKKVEAEVVKINGVEVERQIINEVVLSQPKTQTMKVGTKPIPAKYGTGIFGRPSYGTLTSRFGRRWGGRHTGIDLASKTGSPIYASDGGKVIFAGREGNYGLLVKIDHDNGYVTYYGHCSKLLVKAGDRVAKGEEIAKVGSTGRSTGPHVHFEVRKNGVPQNPLNYLK